MSLSVALVLIHFNIVYSLCIHTQSLSHVQLFVTQWTVAHQVFKTEYGVGCHFLLQGILLTQKSNPGLLCLLVWQVDSLPLSHLGSHIHCMFILFNNEKQRLHILCKLSYIQNLNKFYRASKNQ